MSRRAVDEARRCDTLYAELYTMKLATTPTALSELLGKQVTLLPRGGLEERGGEVIDEARNRRVGVLVGGDCLSATTHISLVLDAAKRGVKTRIIHGSSIFTAVAETGLSLYKFGRTVTMPLPEKGPADTTRRGIEENLQSGLHTLVLLDLDAEKGVYMTISQALARLIEAGLKSDTLVVGAARLGHDDSTMKAGKAGDLATQQFGDPPHSLVVPGSLHFLEEDALKTLAGCPPELLKERVVKPEIDGLIDKYTAGCRRVRNEMRLGALPTEVTGERIEALLDHVDRYVADAKYYRGERKSTALTSVAYAEGILDALKLLGLAEFEW